MSPHGILPGEPLLAHGARGLVARIPMHRHHVALESLAPAVALPTRGAGVGVDAQVPLLVSLEGTEGVKRRSACLTLVPSRLQSQWGIFSLRILVEALDFSGCR